MAHDLLDGFFNCAFARTVAGLATAFILATLIGAERQWRQRTAGYSENCWTPRNLLDSTEKSAEVDPWSR